MSKLLHIPSGKTVAIRPDLFEHPLRIELPRNRRPAWITLALLSLWGAFGTVGLFFGLARLSTQSGPWFWLPLALAMIATLIAIYIGVLAMRLYVSNDTILLFEDHAKITSYSLFGKTAWTAQLDEYDHVRCRQITSDANANQKPYQLIELVHHNEDMTLPLYLEKTPHPLPHIAEKFADRFKLPVR